MNDSQVAFAREIRRMETDEVKRLSFPKMLALARFETRTIIDDLRFAEVQETMEMLPEGGTRRNAKHRSRTRPNTGRVDAGSIAKGRVTVEWRGMSGHAAKVRAHKAKVAVARKREQTFAELSADRASLGTQADYN